MIEASHMIAGLEALAAGLAKLIALLSPFGPDSRLHWTGLSAFLILGMAVYWHEQRRNQAGSEGLVRFLFPPAHYRTASALVDIKVYIFGQLFRPLIALIVVPLNALVAAATAALVAGITRGAAPAQVGMTDFLLAAFLAATAVDFTYYVIHRLSHESEWLWPFHKLHHSAEVLTPVTAKRNHPIFELLLALAGVVIVAPTTGVIFGLFGIAGLPTIFGITVLIVIMNLAGGALRHSHIWVDYGPVLDRVFISPAQHQIHHSVAVHHHDRNYGLSLAIWDWMFGTLYVPHGREALDFGVADRNGQPLPQVHHTLRDAYLVPFEEIAELLRERRLSRHGARA